MDNQETFTILTEDHIELFAQKWVGKGATINPPSKILCIVHGFGEHGGRYLHVPGFLGDVFQSFYAIDLRGHGRSGGMRGDAPDIDTFVADLKHALIELRKREPTTSKFYLLAHSFGGLIALKLLLQEKKVGLEAAIISAPLLGLKLRIPKYKTVLANVLAHTVPRAQLSNEVNPSHLSHDPAIVEAYIKDRLVHRKMTPRLYIDLVRSMDWVVEQPGPLACPSLFLVPGSDKIVDSDRTLDFYRKIKYRYKQLMQYPHLYHEVFNEVDKAKVFEDVHQWVAKI